MKVDWRRITRFVAFVGTLFIGRVVVGPALDFLLPLGWFEPLVDRFGPLAAARSVAVVGVAIVVGAAMGVWWAASKWLGLPSYDPPR